MTGTTVSKLRCGVPFCNEQVNPLGYCDVHPLYCQCSEPDLDAWRMCRRCFRKPLALMAVPS